LLVACGTTLLWYYIVFDRDLILSHIVGSTPHQLDVWSLLHTAVPACGLLVIAFLGQAFPEMWHWLRNVLEPIARTSS
jgi:hypothetical protein